MLGGGDEDEEEEEGSVVQSVRSVSPTAPIPDLVNTDGTLMLFPGNSCSRTGSVWFQMMKVVSCSQMFTLESSALLHSNGLRKYVPAGHNKMGENW